MLINLNESGYLSIHEICMHFVHLRKKDVQVRQSFDMEKKNAVISHRVQRQMRSHAHKHTQN